MLNRSRLVLAALAAVALLAVAVDGASAGRLSVTERNFELIWNEALTGKSKLEFNAASMQAIQCNVTYLGHFIERTITKTTGNNQGAITHGELSGCVGGLVTLRTETMPWNLRYRSFAGALPNITGLGLGIVNAQYRAESSGLTCEVATEVNAPAVVTLETFSAGAPENVRADENATIPLGGACAFISPGRIGGRGLIRNLPRTAKLTITLI